MPTIDSNYIFIPGPGVLARQTYTATIANQFMRMSTFGATGGLKVSTNREIVEWEEGSPLQVVVRDVLREKGEVEIILAEKSLDDLVVETGDGTVVSEDTQTITSEVHHLWLRNFGWQIVPGVPAGGLTNAQTGVVSPTTTIVSLTSATATPIPYTVDVDYQVGNVEGSLAISKLSGTTTITEGEEVILTVTYTLPPRKYLSMGGRNNLAYNHLYSTKIFRDGVNREYTRFYKSTTSGTIEENYSKTGYSERTCKFALLSDTTRTVGDRIWRKFQETPA